MTGVRKLTGFTETLSVAGVDVEIAGSRRDGTGIPLVFLHGFGSTHEDYADIVQLDAFDDRPVLAYDAPGCGRSSCARPAALSIDFLVQVAEAMLDRWGIDRCHIVGHSMGGLTALVLADRSPERIASFTNIEGNVAPEDCFLSRQIVEHHHPDAQTFFDHFVRRVGASKFYSSALYASALPHKVRPSTVEPVFASMVDLSDHGDLLGKFLDFRAPTMFMYGEQNNTLSYLPTMREHGVELAEIENCGHFPMYSNAPQMWSNIQSFVRSAEAR